MADLVREEDKIPLSRLHYQICRQSIVFPYQNEIENLMLELGMSRDGLGEKRIYVAQGVYLQYHNDPHGWHLCCDPTDDEYDSSTGQFIGYNINRQR